MTCTALATILASLLSVQTCPAAVRLADGPSGCLVATDHYQLIVGVASDPMVRLMARDGKHELTTLRSLWLEADGKRFTTTPADPRPHFHPLHSGPYLVELHLENLVLAGDRDEWAGLAELSLFCQEDRVYLLAAFICADKEWVNRGLYVYPAPEGHRDCPPVGPSAYGLSLGVDTGHAAPTLSTFDCVVDGKPKLYLRRTVPREASLRRANGAISAACQPVPESWQRGSAHEVGAMVAVGSGPTGSWFRPFEDGDPLPVTAFAMTMGQAVGFDPARGVYALTAQTSGTPEPPRGLRAGTRYTVRNTGARRTILVDQRDPWGGISGGILRDGAGEPLPIVPQFGLNFPELNAEAGEPGWATMTYPLDLAPNETREIRAEHLYHALSDREIIYLTSLDNVGDPLLLQTTVGRCESHTLTTGPYPGELKPGNELRINDFRRIYSQIKVRSVSAILPTFFGYWDAAGTYQGLMPGLISFRETSPFLIEYTVDAATPDRAVAGRVRIWQAAHSDMTRVFTDVSLGVRKAVRLSPDRPAPLCFLRHHAFNPMAFRKFAFTALDGSTRAGDLDFARAVPVNGSPMAALPLACLYQASNGLDQGLPCSDITGNPGFVLLDWDVTIGGRPVRPGCYAFTCGANDGGEDGAYARDVAVVPSDRVTEIAAGSHIRYRAVQMVFGDNSSDATAMERERDRWAVHPLHAAATIGEVLSNDPPEIRARAGRIACEIAGGADWVPVRVVGFQPGKRLHVRQTDASGSRELGPGAPDEPWYNAWPAKDARCGFTFLIRTGRAGEAVKLEAWQ